ncbi:MAG: hypothetical protein FIA95_09785 [Gemmatimonadetes bacterium]|nr:hypothetical protein [Gemmatimonadota bacterium]
MTSPASLPSVRRRSRFPLLAALLVAGAGGAAACGDDPFAIDWVESPDTVLLYALMRPELNLPSGFDFYNRVGVVIESANATGAWDMAVDSRGGKIVLLPPGALGVSSKAQVAPLRGRTFADVTEAPADTALYVSRLAVPVEMGTVYVWRSRQNYGYYGTSCVYYSKMEAVEMDPAAGTLSFVFDSSPVCNDRSLIPPK